MPMKRMLILSEWFVAGDAVTALNLFSEWDKNDLFCASRRDDFFADNFTQCYKIGGDEVKFRFPFSLVDKQSKSEIINSLRYKPQGKISPPTKSFYGTYIMPFLQYMGLFSYRMHYVVSKKFVSWIKEIKPSYIYTSVGSLNMAYFVRDLMYIFPEIEFVIHCYDDWTNPNFHAVLGNYTGKSQKVLNQILLSTSKVCTTTDKMSSDYSVIYNKTFRIFPNPVSPINVSAEIKPNTLLFLGKISNHNYESIINVAQALNELRDKEDISIDFNIYTEIDPIKKERICHEYNRCFFHSWVGRDEAMKLVKTSSILLLPISINEQTIKFTKYSMSTKMAEYLSSGNPILYIGPDGIAMTEVLKRNNCAFVVDSLSKDVLKTQILSIINDASLRETKLKNAKQLFADHYSKEHVIPSFYDFILK